MMYHSEGFIVYDKNGKVMCAVTPVNFRKWVCIDSARMIANLMNAREDETSRDVLSTLH